MAGRDSPPGPAGDSRSPRPAVVVATLSLCGIVVSLQQTLVIPLLPDLPRLLDTSAATASWLVTATLLTGAVATPTISRLADMYGKKRMILLALGVSVVGSLVGSLGQSPELLITARALQGVGMSMIPVGIAMMRDELPQERVPLGVALMSATLAIGAGAGMPLAGLITRHLDWHAVFWLTGGVGLVLALTAAWLLPESSVRTRGTFDVRGAVLLSTALTALLVALSKGGQWGWLTAPTIGCLVAGLAILAVWGPLELRTSSPLVDLRVASRRPVLVVNLASVLLGFALFANMLVTTQLLQAPVGTGYGQGLDVLSTGLWMAPSALAFALMAPVTAAMVRRIGPQRSLVIGSAIACVAYVVRVFLSDSIAQVVAGSVVVTIGTALTYGAIPTHIMRAVPITETASANGLNVLLRAVGTSTASATSAAVAAASVTTVAGQRYPAYEGLALIFWLAATAALGATILAATTVRPSARTEREPLGVDALGRRTHVVRGQVLGPQGRPVRNAVVTVLTPDGASVDWGQADAEGRFMAALPRSDDYLVVTTADGWRPRSSLMPIDVDAPLPPIVLWERRRLEGTIHGPDGAPEIDALVVVTRHTGEAVTSVRTDLDGHYEISRPPAGRYVLTVVSHAGTTAARAFTVLEDGRPVDLQLGTPLA